MSMISLMMALVASERREVVVIDMGDVNLPTSFPPDVPAVPMLDPALAAKAAHGLATAYGDLPWTLPGHPIVKGRILEQAKGLNRKQDRARGIYGKRGKR